MKWVLLIIRKSKGLCPCGCYLYVDGEESEWFDVIVTDNMFGDIVTDLGAMIQVEWYCSWWKHKSGRSIHV